MTDVTETAGLHERRVEAIAKNRFERTNDIKWEVLCKNAPEAAYGWRVGAERDVAADPATALLDRAAEVLNGARIDIEYKRTHSQTKIAVMNAVNTQKKIDALLRDINGVNDG